LNRLQISRNAWGTVCVLCSLAVLLLFAFSDTVFSEQTLFSPDSPPLFGKNTGINIVRSWLGDWRSESLGVGRGGGGLEPLKLVSLLLPPLVYYEATYVLAILMLIFAAWYYLRGRGVRGVACLLPGIAMGFAGYGFTLISAGHRGIFLMMPYGVLLFGLVDRAVARRSLWHFAAIGLCIPFGIASQPDVMGLFTLLATVYGLFRALSRFLMAKEQRGRLLLHLLLGGLLAGAVTAGASLNAFRHLWQNVIPRRTAEINASTDGKWEYATNWSLPPEDALEFVAPCVFGRESWDRNGPYWGRLGRPLAWDKLRSRLDELQGNPNASAEEIAQLRFGLLRSLNLRQHTVYLGVIQLLVGVFALVWAIALLCRQKAEGADEMPDPPAGSGERRNDILFWSVATLVCVWLAFGRYSPLYRIFYLLPMASKIRCPVKFIHLADLGVCVLFGFGMDALLGMVRQRAEADPKQGKKKAKRRAAVDRTGAHGRSLLKAYFFAVTALALLLLVGAVGVGLSRGQLAGHWNSIGLDRNAVIWRQLGVADGHALMLSVMRSALVHGGVLALVTAACFGAAAFSRSRRTYTVVAVSLAAVLMIDLGVVGKRYVRTRDLGPYYAPNPIAEEMKSRDGHWRVSWRLSPPTKLDPLWQNLTTVHGVDAVEFRQDRPVTDDLRAFFAALEKFPVRVWQLTSTRFIAGPKAQLQRLSQSPGFRTAQELNVANGRLSRAYGNGNALLVEFEQALPRALVYRSWEVMEPEQALGRLAGQEWNPAASGLVSGDVPARPGTLAPVAATILDHRPNRVEVQVASDSEGILCLNDRYSAEWRAEVDGKSAQVLRCNGIMRGVLVTPGKHTVVFTYRHPFLVPFLVCVATAIAVLGWGAFLALHQRKQEVSDA